MSLRPRRHIEPEWLDRIPPPDGAAESLQDLVRINRFSGGHRILRGLLRRSVPSGGSFSFLDVGCGSGDMGREVLRTWPLSRVTSLDYRLSHLKPAAGEKVAADAFHLPFAPRSFDFVFCSLFLHHFSDAGVVELLAAFRRVARRGVLVIDLERHPVAWYALPLTRWLFGWHPITLHDGPVSVQASFNAGELRRLAGRAGLPEPLVRTHRPWFRLSLVSKMY